MVIAVNNTRRLRLRQAISKLNEASDIVSSVADDESDSADNIPENLQAGDIYEKMELAVDYLNDAIDFIDDAKETIWKAM